MGFSLNYYRIKKMQLLNQLDKLQVVLQAMGNDTYLKKVEELRNQVENEHFQISVVGEFSRGKSTFINALLGKKFLPSSVKPTTTVLNIINYSKEPFIKLHNRKNGEEYISEEEFKRLVAPREPIVGDNESEKQYKEQVDYIGSIKYAEIGYPLSFCQEGVRIIDTPGTNDLDPAREMLTNSIIPQSDAAIILLSATMILSESEMSFLKDRILANDVQKIFIVVNHKDLLASSEDVEKVYNYAYKNLKDILQEPKIYMVSSKEALNARRKATGEELKNMRGRPISVKPFEESGFIELESALGDFLQFERGAVKLQRPIQRLEKLVAEVLEKQINFEYGSLNQQMEGLREKVRSFRKRVELIRRAGKDSLKKIDIALNLEESEVTKWYHAELVKITEKGLGTFEANRNLGIDEIGGKVEREIAPLERKLHEDKKKKMTETAIRIIEDISRQLNNEWFKLEGDMQSHGFLNTYNSKDMVQSDSLLPETIAKRSIFNDIFDDLGTAWETENSFIGKLAIGAGYIAATVIGATSFLVGGLWAWLTGDTEKEKFRRKLTEQMNSTEKKRRLQFKSEWDGMVNAISKQYRDIVNENVQQVENQLNMLLENAQLEETEINVKRELLKTRSHTLMQVQTDVRGLYHELMDPVKEEDGVKP
ncbi:dynamin family protein [Niallia oryzisoli]|uniref:dynamin family protein n=1 Tax=Niallia oryzisoli TaxID=1737571 RepID=UPI003734CD72